MGKTHVEKIRKGVTHTRPTTTLGYGRPTNLDSKGNFNDNANGAYNNNSNRSNRN